jgi:hypothetical protein
MAKSPPLRLLRRPFDQAESRFRAKWKQEMETWKEGKEDRGPKPVLERCQVGNITMECLRVILDENPRGVALIRNELSGMIAGFNQYKQGGDDRQFVTDLWDGTPIITDRKSDRLQGGAPVFVLDAYCSIYGTIQPDVVSSMRQAGSRRGTSLNDGFLDRFLFAYPQDVPVVGEQWRSVSSQVRAVWEDAVKELLSLKMNPEKKPPRPILLKLSADGKHAWQRFTEEHATEMNAEDFPPHLRGPWVKLRAYGARLALILRCLRWACNQATRKRDDLNDVDSASVVAATQLVDYFKSHARKVYLAMDADPQTAGARKLLNWLTKEARKTFSKREAYMGVRPTFKTVPEMEPALTILERHHIIRPRGASERSGPGRPRSEEYEVNPKLAHPHEQNAHNTQNSTGTPSGGNCAHSAHSAHGVTGVGASSQREPGEEG